MKIGSGHKEMGREEEILDFLYPVTGLVILGDSIWMRMATGELRVVCVSGDVGYSSFVA